MSQIKQTWATFRETVDFTPGLVLGVFVLVSCGLMAINFDREAALAIKDAVGPGTKEVFNVITDLGRGEPWYAIALIVWLVARWQAPIATTEKDREDYLRWAHSAKFMFWAMLASGLVVLLVKPIIGRLRPRYLFENGDYGFTPFNLDYGMNTFPSGHSQAIWSAMIALMFIFPKAHWVVIPVAVIVASSRAILTVHYPSDVLMGSFLGIIMTIWIKQYFERDGKLVKLFS